MWKKLPILFIICITCSYELVLANYSRFEHYSTDNSTLPSDYIIRALSDSYGFLWLGTMDGLSRYDGYTFKNYFSRPNDSTSLSGNTIISLIEDSRNNMWFGTKYNGLNRFDRQQQRFYQYKKSNNSNGLQSNRISAITEDAEGNIWLGTDAGVHRLLLESNTINNYTFDTDQVSGNQFHRDYIISLLGDKQGIWAGTGKGLYYFPLNNNESYRIDDRSNYEGKLSDTAIMKLIEHHGFIWVLTGRGLDKIDTQNKKIENYGHHLKKFSPYDLRNMIAIKQDIWIATRHDGIYQLNTDTFELQHYGHSSHFADSLSKNSVTTLTVDQSNILWIGSYLGGLNKLPLSNLQFHWSRHFVDIPNTISDGEVNDILEDQHGSLWILTDKYLNKYVPAKNMYTHYPASSFSSDQHTNVILTRFSQSANYLWIATKNDGVKKFDKRSQKIEHFFSLLNYDDAKNNSIFRIHFDNKQRLWFSTDIGLFQINIQRNKIKRYLHYDEDKTSISASEGINTIGEDAYGNLWFGTLNGLNRYVENTDSFKYYRHFAKNSHSLSSDQITTIITDINKPEILWVGTQNGLNRLNIKTNKIERLLYDENRKIYIDKVLQSDNGDLWVSTNKGLIHHNIQTGENTHYYKKDGLQENTFMSYGATKDSNGFMHFGGPMGLTTFNPKEISTNNKAPDILISNIRINGQAISPAYHAANQTLTLSTYPRQAITLTYEKNNISLDFSVLDFTQPENNQFAFKINGIYDQWQYRKASHRTVEFTDLSPNTYQLYFKGGNHRGIWSNKLKQFTIQLLPPWWRTWWAYGIYAVAVIVLIMGVIQYRTTQLSRRATELEAIVHNRTEELHNKNNFIEQQKNELSLLISEKDRIFANISHEFRTPLTLILSPIKGMLQRISNTKEKEELTLIQRNAFRLLRLIGQLLELSRLQRKDTLINNSQEKPQIFIKPVTNAIINTFKHIAENRSLELINHCHINGNIYCSYDAYEKILVNIISNSIKYTLPGGKINISDHWLDSSSIVIITVKDNGIGIPDDQQEYIFERFARVGDKSNEKSPGAGIGLALVKELVDAVNGTISVKSELGVGSEFTLCLPGQLIDANEADMDTNSSRSTETYDNGNSPYDDIDNLSLEVMHLTTDIRCENNTDEPMTENDNDEKKTLLIIEDNPDMRTYLKTQLYDRYHCSSAKDGKQGFHKACEIIPDLIICDIMMPELDGYEVCQQLKQDERTSHIPFILLTALVDRESRIKGLEELADDYMTKPFDIEELQIRIENLLSIRGILRQQFSSQVNLRFTSNEKLDLANSTLTVKDKKFMTRFDKIIAENYQNQNFSVEDIASNIYITRRQLLRKLRAIINQSPGEYIRSYRIKKAAELLADGLNIDQISFETGFSNRNYFSACFKAQMGLTPKQYQDKYLVRLLE